MRRVWGQSREALVTKERHDVRGPGRGMEREPGWHDPVGTPCYDDNPCYGLVVLEHLCVKRRRQDTVGT